MNFKSNKVTSAIVKGTAVSLRATKDGTLVVTDTIEYGTCKVFTTLGEVHQHHKEARADRWLARAVRRDEKKAAAVKATAEAATS